MHHRTPEPCLIKSRGLGRSPSAKSPSKTATRVPSTTVTALSGRCAPPWHSPPPQDPGERSPTGPEAPGRPVDPRKPGMGSSETERFRSLDPLGGNDFVPSGRKTARKRSLGAPEPPEKGHGSRRRGAVCPSSRIGVDPRNLQQVSRLTPLEVKSRGARKPGGRPRNLPLICPSRAAPAPGKRGSGPGSAPGKPRARVQRISCLCQ